MSNLLMSLYSSYDTTTLSFVRPCLMSLLGILTSRHANIKIRANINATSVRPDLT